MDTTLRVKVDGSVAVAQADRLGKSLKGLEDSGKRVAASVKRASDQTRGWSVQSSRTRRDVDNLTRSADRQNNSVTRLRRSALRLGAGFVGVAAIGRAFGAATTGAIEFETNLGRIQGLVGASASDIDKFKEAIISLSNETGKSTGELSNALFFITSAGLEGAQALDALRSSALASVAGLGDTATVADAVTSAINAYGAESLTSAMATDVLVAAVREGKLEASALASSISQVLPTASKFGVQFGEVSGILAAFSRTGTSASEGATQLNGILNGLLRPSEDLKVKIDELFDGFSGLETAVGERGLLPVLKDLFDSVGGQTDQFAKLFTNIRGLSGSFQILGERFAVANQITNDVTDSAGATTKAYDVQADTIQNKLNRATEELNNNLQQLSDTYLPAAANSLGFFARLSTGASNGIDNFSSGIRRLLGQDTTLLEDLQNEIGVLEQELDQRRLQLKMGVEVDPVSLNETIAEFQALSDLQNRILNVPAEPSGSIVAPRVSPIIPGESSASSETGTITDAQENAIKRLQTAYEGLNNQLEREIALTGDLTREEEVLFEIQQGRLKGLGADGQEVVLSKAREIDQAQRLKIALEEEADAREALADAQLEQFLKIQQPRVEDLETQMKSIDLAKDFGATFSSAFEEAIIGGNNFRDVLDGLLQDILRIAARKAIIEPLIGGLFGGGGSAGLLSGLFGGGTGFTAETNALIAAAPSQIPSGLIARAEGGPFNANDRLLVGERGPELVQFPSGGTVIPNDALGSMGSGTNITVINNRSEDTDVNVQDQGGGNLEIEVSKIIAKDFASGGPASQSLTGGFDINRRINTR